jgi:purine-binding chemotaxis protein CheW
MQPEGQAMTSSPALRELISFRVSEQEYGVNITDVREIRGWTPATPLPRTPNYVRGVINLRGSVLPILDMGARMGFGLSEPSQRHVIIVVWIRGQHVGLLVDAVCDILQVDSDALHATPDLVGDEAHEFVEGIISIDERMIGLIQLDALMPPEEQQAA